jgi:hypothetical protein
MAKDLTVFLEDRPGTLTAMGKALGKAGINIDGLCGFPCEGRGVGHILVEDAEGARRALEAIGLEVSDERDVMILEVENRSGSLGEIAQKIADSGANIDLIYVASNSRLVIGADDLEKAQAAL